MPVYCRLCTPRAYVVNCELCAEARDADIDSWDYDRAEEEFHTATADLPFRKREFLRDLARRFYDIGRG